MLTFALFTGQQPICPGVYKCRPLLYGNASWRKCSNWCTTRLCLLSSVSFNNEHNTIMQKALNGKGITWGRLDISFSVCNIKNLQYKRQTDLSASKSYIIYHWQYFKRLKKTKTNFKGKQCISPKIVQKKNV